MIKNLMLLGCFLVIAGCGNKSDIEAAVKEGLRDPDSAKFQDLVESDSGEYACIEWNAKNGFGGYSEWSIARLRKVDGTWTVLEINANSSYCNEEAFVRRQEVDQANDKWRKN